MHIDKLSVGGGKETTIHLVKIARILDVGGGNFSLMAVTMVTLYSLLMEKMSFTAS
jgi:hypothetical protein